MSDALHEVGPQYQVMPPESQFRELADRIYEEKVLRARRMSPAEKFISGEELFSMACAITLAGIQHQHPELGPEGRLQMLRNRLALRDRMERADIGK